MLVTLVGAMGTMYNSSNNTILQLNSPDNLRGRLMSVVFLSHALVPMGAAVAGTLASVVGAPWAMGSMAALVAVLAVVIWVAVPSLKVLE
jgi:hypothetical protein